MNRLKLLAAALSLSVARPLGVQAQAGRRGTVLDANTASEKQLVSVRGLTPMLVKGILERRPFVNMTDLDALLGQSLSPDQRTEVYRRLFVQINLNTASDAEIPLIPGTGQRMVPGFKDHRPYRTLAQFRREIGKYVDDKEIARLENTSLRRSTSIQRATPTSSPSPGWASACCTNSRSTGHTGQSSSFGARLESTSMTKRSPGWSATSR